MPASCPQLDVSAELLPLVEISLGDLAVISALMLVGQACIPHKERAAKGAAGLEGGFAELQLQLLNICSHPLMCVMTVPMLTRGGGTHTISCWRLRSCCCSPGAPSSAQLSGGLLSAACSSAR